MDCEEDIDASREEGRGVAGFEKDSVKSCENDCGEGRNEDCGEGCRVGCKEVNCGVDCEEGIKVDSEKRVKVGCEEIKGRVNGEEACKADRREDFEMDCKEENCRVDCDEKSTVGREDNCAESFKKDCKVGREDDSKTNGGKGIEDDREKFCDDDCRTSVRLAYIKLIHGLRTVMNSVKLADGPSAFDGWNGDSVFGDGSLVAVARKSHRCVTFTVTDAPATVISSKHDVAAYDNSFSCFITPIRTCIANLTTERNEKKD